MNMSVRQCRFLWWGIHVIDHRNTPYYSVEHARQIWIQYTYCQQTEDASCPYRWNGSNHCSLRKNNQNAIRQQIIIFHLQKIKSNPNSNTASNSAKIEIIPFHYWFIDIYKMPMKSLQKYEIPIWYKTRKFNIHFLSTNDTHCRWWSLGLLT